MSTKRIAITGATGFVGLSCVKHALDLGYIVDVIDAGDRLGRLSGINGSPNLNFQQINLAREVPILAENTQAILHLAALPHVDYSRYYPEHTIENNVRALLNTLEASRITNTPIIFTSSVEVYGGNEGERFAEEAILNPLSPYSASKVAGEGMVKAYISAFGVRATNVRFTNLYGPWQAPDRIIPRLITQTLLNHPRQVEIGRIRDFLFVEDAVRALFDIVEHQAWDKTINISSGVGVDNAEVASLIAAIFGKSGNRFERIPANTNDGRGCSLVASPQRLMSLTSWKPSVQLTEGLLKTVEWYKSNSKWWLHFSDSIKAGRRDPAFIIDFKMPLC